MADIRCSWPDELWASWQQPDDRSNRRQLQRIVSEWDAMQNITDRLREIDSDISIAFGKLLATYSLANDYGLNVTAATEKTEQAIAPSPSSVAADFEIPLDDCF